MRSSANSSSTAGVGRPLTQAEEEDEEEDDVYDDYYPVEEEASRRQSVFSSTSFRLNSSSSSICGVSGASAVTSSEQGDYSLVANPYERLIHYFSRSPRAHSASYSFDSVLLGKDNRQLFHNTPIRELIRKARRGVWERDSIERGDISPPF